MHQLINAKSKVCTGRQHCAFLLVCFHLHHALSFYTAALQAHQNVLQIREQANTKRKRGNREKLKQTRVRRMSISEARFGNDVYNV